MQNSYAAFSVIKLKKIDMWIGHKTKTSVAVFFFFEVLLMFTYYKLQSDIVSLKH